MVKIIESTAEFNELINSDKKVIVDFYADWCGYVFYLLLHIQIFFIKFLIRLGGVPRDE